jgi:hypothetical protein
MPSSLDVKILEIVAVFWGICGVIAFAAHVATQRMSRDWTELPFQFVAATVLGAIALIGVLEDRWS